MVIKTVPAIKGPHMISRLPTMSAIPTDRVLNSVVRIRVRDIINSCQARIKENRPMAATAGAAIGNTILKIVRTVPQPSIAAASSSSTGSPSKYDFSMSVAKGMAKVQ